jgi:predicted nuclease of predicted toxin-antitoxin system
MRFLADENFNHDILWDVWQYIPDATISRVQDLIPNAEDNQILEYAARNSYLLLSHDVNTMRSLYEERLSAGLSVPGVLLVHKETLIDLVIDELQVIILTSAQAEWDGKITYIPLR